MRTSLVPGAWTCAVENANRYFEMNRIAEGGARPGFTEPVLSRCARDCDCRRPHSRARGGSNSPDASGMRTPDIGIGATMRLNTCLSLSILELHAGVTRSYRDG